MGSQPIHDGEPDTSEPILRAVLREQRPEWADRPVTYIDSTGTSNAIWRVHLAPTVARAPRDVAVRLPRSPGAAESVERECRLLPALRESFSPLIATPAVEHVGASGDHFPFAWAALSWLPGDDLWHRAPDPRQQAALVDDLAYVIETTRGIDAPAATRRGGDRGGPIGPLLERLHVWLADDRWNASSHLDAGAVRRAIDAATDAALEPRMDADCLTHGDLIPGNLLVADGRLAAVIDWGGAGIGDPAQDLAPAWSVFDVAARQAFRERLGVDEPTWQRARLFELEHSVGGILYYAPRRHVLADVMRTTLTRLLEDV